LTEQATLFPVCEEAKPMSAGRSPLCLGGLVLPAVLLMAATAGAAVVTKRLSTGLPSPQASDDLPQAWVAPGKQSPTIDGRLDEKVWEATRPVVLGKLERYGEASPPTVVRFLHKGGVLYVGAALGEPDVEKLKRSAAKHDGPTCDDDSLELFLQPDVNRDYYQLVISASGAIYDRQNHDEPADWDSQAKAVVAVGPQAGRWRPPFPWRRWARAGADPQVGTLNAGG
jgi:hypothetical protein